MTVRLLLDSAAASAWRAWWPSGLFCGITTNPTLLRRAGRPCEIEELRRLSAEALALGVEELHLQAWGADAAALAACGSALAALEPGIVLVKLPITRSGLDAGRRLIDQGVPITFTACYEGHQVLLAAALGARYIAPYLGRITDQGRAGAAELVAMQRALDGVGSTTQLLVASLRQPAELVPLAAAGLRCFTLAPPVAGALLQVEATTAAAEQFERDAAPSAPA